MGTTLNYVMKSAALDNISNNKTIRAYKSIILMIFVNGLKL